MKLETAQKAAKWWADHLRTVKQFDNGDNSETGAMTMILGLMPSDSLASKRTEAQVIKFESALVDALLKLDDYQASWALDVDYHPSRVLNEAATVAGIVVDGALPWKTSMRIDGDRIYVREGYGAGQVEI